MTVLAVAIGGAVGAIGRYSMSAWIQRAAGPAFPWGTLAVNVLGSMALGFLFIWLQRTAAGHEVRQLLTVGLLGSFTTFSTFSLEAAVLLQDGDWWRAGTYVSGSVALSLAAVFAGMAIAANVVSAQG